MSKKIIYLVGGILIQILFMYLLPFLMYSFQNLIIQIANNPNQSLNITTFIYRFNYGLIATMLYIIVLLLIERKKLINPSEAKAKKLEKLKIKMQNIERE